MTVLQVLYTYLSQHKSYHLPNSDQSEGAVVEMAGGFTLVENEDIPHSPLSLMPQHTKDPLSKINGMTVAASICVKVVKILQLALVKLHKHHYHTRLMCLW